MRFQRWQARRQLYIDAIQRASTPVLSYQSNLKDIPVPTISNYICILLADTLQIEDGHVLARALVSLASRLAIPEVSLTLMLDCTPDVFAIVQEGLQAFQGLKELALVFEDDSEGLSSSFAKDIVNGLTNKTKHGFPFADLPRELRHQILSYVLDPESEKDIIDVKYQRILSSCCKTCTFIINSHHDGCACSSIVTGYSTTCTCQTQDFSIFRVSRMLYEDANFICFKKNRFRFTGIRDGLRFLTSQRDASLQLLRQVDFVMVYEDVHLFKDGPPDDFTKLVDIIATKCDIGQLHLSVDYNWDPASLTNFKESQWTQHQNSLWNLAYALAPLKGVSRIDIDLGLYGDQEDAMVDIIFGKGQMIEALHE